MSTEDVQILDYNSRYNNAFRDLNVEWLEKYFVVEEIDLPLLDHPKEEIIEKGGAILFAKLDEEIVGTVALLNKEEAGLELAKMGVTEKHQGKKIGKRLVFAALEKAKTMGAKRVYLETNSSLTPAIKLYEKCGFKHIAPMKKSKYARSDTVMELWL